MLKTFLNQRKAQIDDRILKKEQVLTNNELIKNMSIYNAASIYGEYNSLVKLKEQLNNIISELKNSDYKENILIRFFYQITNGDVSFDCYHPLAGYETFHKMLLDHYKESGNDGKYGCLQQIIEEISRK